MTEQHIKKCPGIPLHWKAVSGAGRPLAEYGSQGLYNYKNCHQSVLWGGGKPWEDISNGSSQDCRLPFSLLRNKSPELNTSDRDGVSWDFSLWEPDFSGGPSWELICVVGLLCSPKDPDIPAAQLLSWQKAGRHLVEVYWKWNASVKTSGFSVSTFFSEKLFTWKILDQLFLEAIIWVN